MSDSFSSRVCAVPMFGTSFTPTPPSHRPRWSEATCGWSMCPAFIQLLFESTLDVVEMTVMYWWSGGDGLGLHQPGNLLLEHSPSTYTSTTLQAIWLASSTLKLVSIGALTSLYSVSRLDRLVTLLLPTNVTAPCRCHVQYRRCHALGLPRTSAAGRQVLLSVAIVAVFVTLLFCNGVCWLFVT